MASNTILAKMAFQISANTAEFNKALQQSNKNFKSFTNTFKGGLAAIGVGIGVDQLVSFGKEVIKITSEFQKFEAVLTNTLGSNSAAQIALKQIQEFAAKTPFSVQELTSSFVKLANQGFQPTVKEMTKLGDLASSVGKSFDQLTEAIIDAQTGEFERLKEFGIRASKEGDRVTFAFKGVKKQVDFTGESIRKYILSLGDLEGVQGGMAAISETLGGKISNLGDAWDTLLKTLGNGNRGVLMGTVDLLGKALNVANDLLKTTEQRNQEEKLALTDAVLQKYKSFGSEQEKQDFRNKLWARLYDLQIQNTKALGDWSNANYVQYQQRVKDIAVLKEALGLIGDSISKTQEESEEKKRLADEALRLEAEARAKANKEREEELRLQTAIADINRRMTGRAEADTNAFAGVDVGPALERATKSMKSFTDGYRNLATEFKSTTIELEGMIEGALSDTFLAFGAAIAEGFPKDWGKQFLGVLSKFAAQLGAACIAIGVGMIGLKNAFKTPGAAILAGAALLVIAGALGAAASAQKNFNRGSSSSSSEGVSRAGNFITSDLGDRIILSGDFRVSGTDLVAAVTNQNRVDSRTKFPG